MEILEISVSAREIVTEYNTTTQNFTSFTIFETGSTIYIYIYIDRESRRRNERQERA